MSMMTMLLIAWGVLTALLVVLLIYRSTLTIKEDDQLFLDEAEAHMQAEQAELLSRMNRLTPMIRVLGGLSIALILVIGGMWIWQGIAQSHL